MPNIWEDMWPRRVAPVRGNSGGGKKGKRGKGGQRDGGAPVFWDTVFPFPRPGTFAPAQQKVSKREARRRLRSELAKKFYRVLMSREQWRTSELVAVGLQLGISRNYVYVLLNRAKRAGVVRPVKRGVLRVVATGSVDTRLVEGGGVEERIQGIEGDMARGAAYTGYLAAVAAREAWRRRGAVKSAVSRVKGAVERAVREARLRAGDAADAVRERVETYSRDKRYYVEGGGGNG